jgi:hypothetical protein
MKTFYRFLLAWARIDLMIARSTGRGPQFIAALCADERRWEKALWDLEHPLHLGRG